MDKNGLSCMCNQALDARCMQQCTIHIHRFYDYASGAKMNSSSSL